MNTREVPNVCKTNHLQNKLIILHGMVFCRYTAGNSGETCNDNLKWYSSLWVWRGWRGKAKKKKIRTWLLLDAFTMSPSSCHLGVRRASSCFQDGTHHCCVTICILHPWCIAHLQCKTLLTPAGVAVTVHHAKLPSGNMNSSLHKQIRYIFWWNYQCDPCPCIVHVIHFKLLNLSFRKCTVRIAPFVGITSSAPGGRSRQTDHWAQYPCYESSHFLLVMPNGISDCARLER